MSDSCQGATLVLCSIRKDRSSRRMLGKSVAMFTVFSAHQGTLAHILYMKYLTSAVSNLLMELGVPRCALQPVQWQGSHSAAV